MKCTHASYRQVGPDCPFSGSVAVEPYECRGAHGCITYTEECSRCGARRSVNQNQRYVEVAPWGPSRDAREQAARKARAYATVLVSAVPTIRRTDGVTLQMDAEGYIVTALGNDVVALWRSAPPAWRRQAIAARNAILKAQRLDG